MFVPNAGGVADQLYQNLGNGSFEEIAGDVGLASLENNRGALWFEYDGDHRLDLVVGSDCLTERPLSPDPCANPVSPRLYRQKNGGTFEDVTVAADQVITITNGPPIPTASTWGVIAMALLLMIAGTCAFRRTVTSR